MPVQPVMIPAKLKQVVKSVITDDNRFKNVMIFGVDKEVTFNEEAINAGCVSDILCYIDRSIRSLAFEKRKKPDPLDL